MNRRVFSTLGAAAVWSACGARSGAAQVRLANVQGILAPVVAEALGAFGQQGLQVEMSDMPGVSKSVQALVSGSVDVAVGGLDQAIQLQADGVAVQAFFLIGLRPGAALVVSPRASATVRRIPDLKGAAVGVTAPGSTAQWYLYHLLQRDGLRPADVTISGIGTMATALAALEQGRVAAAIVLPYPLASLKRRYPALAVLAEMISAGGTRQAFGVEALPNLCLLARREWLESHEDTARKLAKAMVGSQAWIHSSSPAAIQARLPAASRLEDAAAELDYIARLAEYYSPDGRMPASGPAELVRVLSSSVERFQQLKIDLQSTYTNAFLPA